MTRNRKLNPLQLPSLRTKKFHLMTLTNHYHDLQPKRLVICRVVLLLRMMSIPTGSSELYQVCPFSPPLLSLLTRTVAWVRSFSEDDENVGPTSQLISHSPPNAQVAQHNSSPSSKPARGKLYDHQREWAPPTPSALVSEHASRWRAFAKSSAYPAVARDGGEIVTEEWLIQNGADYSRPWLAGSENGDTEKDASRLFKFQARRKSWWDRLQRTVLRSPVIPLVIRTNVWFFSLVALALGSSIYKKINENDAQAADRSSPTMAVVVDAIALVYILYITYDEYTGKPLGLRSARAKMRLIFLDLFFIVFDSANLSLAFKAVAGCPHQIRNMQKALASVLLIALISWVLTFSISVFR